MLFLFPLVNRFECKVFTKLFTKLFFDAEQFSRRVMSLSTAQKTGYVRVPNDVNDAVLMIPEDLAAPAGVPQPPPPQVPPPEPLPAPPHYGSDDPSIGINSFFNTLFHYGSVNNI